MDELYVVFIFENRMRKIFSAIHPSQFLLSTSSPGLSARIGLLKQNWVCLESYMEEDKESDYYEEVV